MISWRWCILPGGGASLTGIVAPVHAADIGLLPCDVHGAWLQDSSIEAATVYILVKTVNWSSVRTHRSLVIQPARQWRGAKLPHA